MGPSDTDPSTAEQRRSRPRRRLSRIAGVLALAGLSALLAVEIAVRIFVGAPMGERLPIVRVRANEHRGWEMMPGEAHYTYRHRVRVNSLGLRGPEVGPKEPGETRVLTLGDSLLYGQGVAGDQTIPFHMEEMLEERTGAPWTVVNGGHRAYSTHQELALLEELGPEIGPDVVVVFWFWNDVFERDVEGTYERLTEKGPIAFDVGVPLEGAAKLEWYVTEALRRSAALMYLHDLRRAMKAEPIPQRLVDDAMVRFGRYADRFVQNAERMGFRLVYAIVPEPRGLLRPHFAHDIDREAARLLEERDIETLTLGSEVAELARERGRLPTLPFDGHYTGEANRVMAEKVVRSLLAGSGEPARE